MISVSHRDDLVLNSLFLIASGLGDLVLDWLTLVLKGQIADIDLDLLGLGPRYLSANLVGDLLAVGRVSNMTISVSQWSSHNLGGTLERLDLMALLLQLHSGSVYLLVLTGLLGFPDAGLTRFNLFVLNLALGHGDLDRSVWHS